MSRPIVLDDGVWLRATRLLAVVLLLGGVGAGPLAHGIPGVSDAQVVASESDRHGEPGVPDAHHECPVCTTLSSAAAAEVPTTPAASLVDTPPAAFPGAAVQCRPASDLTKARAPPIA